MGETGATPRLVAEDEKEAAADVDPDDAEGKARRYWKTATVNTVDSSTDSGFRTPTFYGFRQHHRPLVSGRGWHGYTQVDHQQISGICLTPDI